MQANSSARRVAITGLGAVTPVGNSARLTWSALIAGKSGIGPITHFDPTGCTARIAGEVRGYDPTASVGSPVHPRGQGSEPVTAPLNPKDVRKLGRFTHLGIGAGLEAYIDSGLDPHRTSIPSERIGINLGVGLGGLPEIVATHETWRLGGFRKYRPFSSCRRPPTSWPASCDPPELPGPQHEHRLGVRDKRPCAWRLRARHPAGRRRRHPSAGAEAAVTPVAVGAFAQMKARSTRNDAPEKASRPTTRTGTDS